MTVSFAPGPQNPNAYGGAAVGPNYLKYGEQTQNGYVYIPQYDKYFVSKKHLQEQLQNQGVVDAPPGTPSLADTIIPVAATVGTIKAGQTLIPELVGSARAGQESGLLGLGKSALGLGGDTTTSALPAAASQATGATGGLLSAGGEGVASSINGGTLTTMSPEVLPGAGAEGAGLFSLNSGGLLGQGAMPIGNYVPGIAGAFGAYDVLSNKKHGLSGAAEGAASGAGIGFTLGGPVGAGVGAGVGAIVGYFGNFGDVDAYKTEWKRKKDLFDRGIITEAQLGPEPMKGKSQSQLEEEAKAQGGNLTFAKSRDEKDLTPIDIQGYATVLEEAHNRGVNPVDLSKMALDAGAVREHHGTIDVDWDKVKAATPPASKTDVAAVNKAADIMKQKGNKPTGLQ